MIGAGDDITLSFESLSLTHHIPELAISEVSLEFDTVAGTADFDPEQYVLHTWIDGIDGSYMQLSAEEGVWLADFGSQGFDLQPGMSGRVELVDQASNATAVEWKTPPAMNLRVNYGHDWVESFYEAGHIVWVTVTEADGETIKATSEVITEPKEYWDWESGFQTMDSYWSDADGNQMENPPDIQPYDWVFAQVDNGVSTQVKIGEIHKDAGSIMPNGEEQYTCTWDPETEWDVQPWQDIGVGYFTPDGHWVANAFRDERWSAMWTYDMDPFFWVAANDQISLF
ncbi:MAG: hypothetical protein ACWGQW_14570 [bacterium]